MPRIDPNFIRYELHVMLEAWPVKQRKRRSPTEHVDAMIKEVEKINETSAITKVLYPSQLSNTVVVKKKNDKQRECVDFSSPNQACLKDSFPLSKIDQLVDLTSSQAPSEDSTFLDFTEGKLVQEVLLRALFVVHSPEMMFCLKFIREFANHTLEANCWCTEL